MRTTKCIEAFYRGIETDVLLELRKNMYRTMVDSRIETYGGYNILYSIKGIETELNIRNIMYKAY